MERANPKSATLMSILVGVVRSTRRFSGLMSTVVLME